MTLSKSLALAAPRLNYRDRALAALIGVGASLVVFVVVDLIEPGFNPINQVISEHLHGPYRWVAFLGFLAIGIAQWSLASAFKVAFRTSKLSKVGFLLMQISAVGFCVAGAFSDASDLVAPQLLHAEIESGFVHLLASMVTFLLIFIAQIMVSIWLARTGQLKRMNRFLLLQAILSPIVFFALPFEGPVGLYQRLFIYCLPLAWTTLAALGLRSKEPTAA